MYRRVLDAVFSKMSCPTEQYVSVALVFTHCLVPQVCCGGLCRVDVPTARTKGVCLFIVETPNDWYNTVAHHYTIKALDRPWSNAGVFECFTLKKERADACLFGVVCCGCGWCWV